MMWVKFIFIFVVSAAGPSLIVGLATNVNCDYNANFKITLPKRNFSETAS